MRSSKAFAGCAPREPGRRCRRSVRGLRRRPAAARSRALLTSASSIDSTSKSPAHPDGAGLQAQLFSIASSFRSARRRSWDRSDRLVAASASAMAFSAAGPVVFARTWASAK